MGIVILWLIVSFMRACSRITCLLVFFFFFCLFAFFFKELQPMFSKIIRDECSVFQINLMFMYDLLEILLFQ